MTIIGVMNQRSRVSMRVATTAKNRPRPIDIAVADVEWMVEAHSTFSVRGSSMTR